MDRLLALLVLAGASGNASTLEVNLRAQYTFNGNSDDQSGNNRNAITYNTAYVPDRFGNASSAIQFNGVSSYVFAENYVFSPNVSSAVTISFWYKQYPNESRPVSLLNEYVLWETLDRPGENFMPQSMSIRSDRILQKGYQGSEAYSSYGAYVPNTWNHVIFTGNSSDQLSTIYIFKSDGTLLTNTTNSFNWGSQFSGNIIFGADRLLRSPYEGHDYFFFGEMDDIRVYDRTLSANEITNLHAIESVPEPASLSLLLAGGAVLMPRRRK